MGCSSLQVQHTGGGDTAGDQSVIWAMVMRRHAGGGFFRTQVRTCAGVQGTFCTKEKCVKILWPGAIHSTTGSTASGCVRLISLIAMLVRGERAICFAALAGRAAEREAECRTLDDDPGNGVAPAPGASALVLMTIGVDSSVWPSCSGAAPTGAISTTPTAPSFATSACL